MARPSRETGAELIRSSADGGIVAILDSRVLTKPYGRTYFDSLPECPRIVEMPELVEVR